MCINRIIPILPMNCLRLLQNMDLATDNGMLNLAGVLIFAERPEWIKPQFIVKAIRYPGNAIHSTEYLDTEDFSGPLRKIFDDATGFYHAQSAQGAGGTRRERSRAFRRFRLPCLKSCWSTH